MTTPKAILRNIIRNFCNYYQMPLTPIIACELANQEKHLVVWNLAKIGRKADKVQIMHDKIVANCPNWTKLAKTTVNN